MNLLIDGGSTGPNWVARPIVAAEVRLAAEMVAEVRTGMAPPTADPVIVSDDHATSTAPPYKARVPQVKWTRMNESRFHILVKRDALGTASRKDIEELDALEQRREHQHNPRTAAEIASDLRQQRAAAELVRALRQYVKVHEATAR